MQPTIRFVNKLIKMRIAAERMGCNKKDHVMGYVNFLDVHIRANKYDRPNDAKLFFLRHSDKIEYIIPGGKNGLLLEFKELHKQCLTKNI